MKNLVTIRFCLTLMTYLFLYIHAQAQSTVVCSPNNTSLHTGYVSGAINWVKVDGNIRVGGDAAPLVNKYYGWIKFNISTIPVGAGIMAISLKTYTSSAAASGHLIKVVRMTVDPELATASSIKSDIVSSTYKFAHSLSVMQSLGIHNTILNDSAISDLQAWYNAGSSYWSIGFCEEIAVGTFGIFNGYGINEPEITVTYCTASPASATIVGADNACQSVPVSYSASSTGATAYNWILPAGWQILTGSGTSTVSILPGANSGVVSVIPVNPCGTGPQSNKSITVGPAPTITSIISNSTFCQSTNVVFTASGTNLLAYNWIVPQGWTIISGQTTSSLTVNLGAISGYIKVIPSNASCNGFPDSLMVNVTVLPGVATITGQDSACQGSPVTLTAVASNANTYNWTVPGGWGISGQGSASIITVAQGASDSVCVVPSNSLCAGNKTCNFINVKLKPDIILTPFQPCCVYNPYFILNNASPSGGTYSGTGIISGTSYFDPTVAGTGTHDITYIYFNPQGCGDTASGTIYVDLCTGIPEEVKTGNISIYPSPNYGKFNICLELSVEERLNYKIFNSIGKVISQGINIPGYKRTEIPIALDNPSPGTYFINIEGQTFHVNKVIIIE